MKHIIKYIHDYPEASTVIAVLLMAIIIPCTLLSIITIQPGYVGIAVRLGKANDTPLDEGLHVVIPFITRVHKTTIRTQKIESTGNEASSKDLQVVTSSIVVNANLNKQDAVKMYREIGVEYQNIIIVPAIAETFKAIAAQYTAEELITERQKVSSGILEALKNKLKDTGVTITQVNIVNFTFSKEFDISIEKKMIAKQAALQSENEVDKARFEAEKKVEEAKGEAEAKLQVAKAEAESLKLKGDTVTPLVIFSNLVEKWNGELPKTVFVGSEVPNPTMLITGASQ